MKSKTEWVNFREIKEKVSMEDILRHYELLKGLRRKENELVGSVPFMMGNARIRGVFVQIRLKTTGTASPVELVTMFWTSYL